MKSFFVLLQDKSTAPLQPQLLQEHIHHLKKLNADNQLLICGPFADDSGAMLVIQAESPTAVDTLIQAVLSSEKATIEITR